jgi:hypothetical protein
MIASVAMGRERVRMMREWLGMMRECPSPRPVLYGEINLHPEHPNLEIERWNLVTGRQHLETEEQKLKKI